MARLSGPRSVVCKFSTHRSCTVTHVSPNGDLNPRPQIIKCQNNNLDHDLEIRSNCRSHQNFSQPYLGQFSIQNKNVWCSEIDSKAFSSHVSPEIDFDLLTLKFGKMPITQKKHILVTLRDIDHVVFSSVGDSFKWDMSASGWRSSQT